MQTIEAPPLLREGQLNRFFELIKTFPVDRVVALENMYSVHNLGEQLINAPASRKAEYHNAFPGGYLDHVLRVFDLVKKQVAIYANFGGWINFTQDEMMFAALHHDLGKLGDTKQPVYLEERDPYWIKKGYSYKQNPDLYPMSYTDRTFYLLQKFGVTMTQNEMVAIRTTDGMYDESTKPYLLGKDRWSMRTNLGYLCHWADHMATIIEKDVVKRPELENRDDI
jgi:hypothetical protein